MGFSLRVHLARTLSWLYLASLYIFIPAMPLLAGIVFWRLKFITHYTQSYRKFLAHVHAMSEGPAFHYFNDVVGQVRQIPVEIQGSCIQCGNCCMEHRCAFLEPIGDAKFSCGIYNSHWRRFSNCGSFPLSQHDIDRYACPSYFVSPRIPVRLHIDKETCLAASTCS
jgi:hypothetical protein